MPHKKPFVSALLVGLVAMVGVAGYFAVRAESSQVEETYVSFDVSPDSSQVVFASADADLYLLNLRTQQVRQLTRSVSLETEPAFSPDGRSIVYASSAKEGGGAGIYVRSLDGRLVRELTRGQTAFDAMPSYSSDGKLITFVRASRHRPYSMGGWTWDNYDVYVMSRDGSGLHQVTKHSYYQANRPHFFRDGKQIIFAASGDYPDTRTYLFSVPADGVQPPAKFMPPTAPLSDDGSSPSYCAVWGGDSSPGLGGKRVAFVSDRAKGYAYDLWVTGASGGKPHALNITGISKYNQQPVFTPDGDHVMFLAGTEENAFSRPIFSLWEVGSDGSLPHRIADSGLFIHPLHWKVEPLRPASPNN